MSRLSTIVLTLLIVSTCLALGLDSLPQIPSAYDLAGLPAHLTPTAQANAKTESAGSGTHPRLHFRDIAIQAGLTTVPHSRSDRRYVLDTMAGGGIALFDCDDDGKLDIAVVNDSTIERCLGGGDLMITLYHQDTNSPNLHFTDITESAGLTIKGWGMGIAVGDFDNDGLPDLYVTGYGHNVLYHNLGNCKFEDVTKKAGLEVGGFSTGAAWADYDRDGLLDLFVASALHLQHGCAIYGEQARRETPKGWNCDARAQCGSCPRSSREQKRRVIWRRPVSYGNHGNGFYQRSAGRRHEILADRLTDEALFGQQQRERPSRFAFRF